jgi:hypothetical protein
MTGEVPIWPNATTEELVGVVFDALEPLLEPPRPGDCTPRLDVMKGGIIWSGLSTMDC